MNLGGHIQYKLKVRGFTIVELLIVVVVIAILAAITIVAYNGIQTRAKASAIASGISSIEKSLRVTAIENGITTWWSDEDYRDSEDESTLAALIEGTPLKNHLKTPPSIVGEDASFWEWDNDYDEGETGYDPAICPPPSDRISEGTNIKMQLTEATAEQIDAAIDDGDLSCGRFRLDPDDDISSGSGAIYLYLINRTNAVE